MFKHVRQTSRTTLKDPEIKIDNKTLKNIDAFTYLGCTLTSNNSLDKEISNWIAKASAASRLKRIVQFIELCLISTTVRMRNMDCIQKTYQVSRADKVGETKSCIANVALICFNLMIRSGVLCNSKP